MDVSIDLEQDRRYRVFAHVGNCLSEDGITVTAHVLREGSLIFSFYTRQDAVTFFRHLLAGAEEATASEEDEEIPGRCLIAEDVTLPFVARATRKG
jgi:hypothetical protein